MCYGIKKKIIVNLFYSDILISIIGEEIVKYENAAGYQKYHFACEYLSQHASEITRCLEENYKISHSQILIILGSHQSFGVVYGRH